MLAKKKYSPRPGFEPGCPKGQAFNHAFQASSRNFFTKILCDTKLRDRGISINAKSRFKSFLYLLKVRNQFLSTVNSSILTFTSLRKSLSSISIELTKVPTLKSTLL